MYSYKKKHTKLHQKVIDHYKDDWIPDTTELQPLSIGSKNNKIRMRYNMCPKHCTFRRERQM